MYVLKCLSVLVILALQLKLIYSVSCQDNMSNFLMLKESSDAHFSLVDVII